MSDVQKEICVLGSGIWGTALACQVSRKLGSCTIFTKSEETYHSINQLNQNKGAHLPKSITAETNFKHLSQYKSIIIATPSHSFEEILKILKTLPENINLIFATKGLDVQRKQLLSTTIHEEVKNPLLILSGASFADEVINGEFTAINLACNDIGRAKSLAKSLSSEKFIVIPGDDIVSLQLSGCMKNIIAILVGIMEGLNYGDNSSSAIIAKGINEIKNFAKLLNPKSDLDCLSIASDTILCCTSIKSRNMSFGMQLAIGITSTNNLVEGALAAKALLDLMDKHNFFSPLIQLAYDCISDPHNLREKIDKAIASVIVN